ncbi:exo-alpha-sialidase [Spirosoma sp. BT702]|uniref:Exo-alpha-sialidase n=1 Tax=Spirosoma profusum TaxID=2771354 RepID=A0A927G9U8_9BACT|nr:sialidase family protein [Spirosoma profusum]MBD2704992.1 exo-alpha-sialidase [Spirosoma profusum]
MRTIFKSMLVGGWLLLLGTVSYATTGNFSDTTRAYAVPTLAKTSKGNVALSWTEKDKDGTTFFYWAESTDKGKTFGDKKLIYSAVGLGSSRLMRPKLLFKKDGSIVAVFAAPGTSVNAPTASAQSGHDHGDAHAGHSSAPKSGGRPSDLQIVYSVSKDGNTWSQPAPVHADKTPNTVRGFFDATLLANDEVAVAYLNDIPGKAHERDLKFVTSKGGKFGDVKTLDPFTCDCCNISLLVDNKGALNLYYRENQENIRDIYKMISTDNGATFTKAENLFADNWKVNGCPHSGPTSSASSAGNLIAWTSGTTDSPGIRVVTQQGKRLFVLDDQSAKNAFLASAPKSAVLLWEQNQALETGLTSVIAYKHITSDQNPATQFVKNAISGTNATGIVIDNQLIVAYEVKKANNKNGVSVAQTEL